MKTILLSSCLALVAVACADEVALMPPPPEHGPAAMGSLARIKPLLESECRELVPSTSAYDAKDLRIADYPEGLKCIERTYGATVKVEYQKLDRDRWWERDPVYRVSVEYKGEFDFFMVILVQFATPYLTDLGLKNLERIWRSGCIKPWFRWLDQTQLTLRQYSTGEWVGDLTLRWEDNQAYARVREDEREGCGN